MMIAPARDVGQGRRRWRVAYLLALALLFLSEVVAVLLLFSIKFNATPLVAAVDLAVLAAIVVAVGLTVRLFPDTRRGNAAAASWVTAVFGLGHYLVSLFGLLATAAYLVAKIPPPLKLALTDPELTLSLLISVGISTTEVMAFLLITLAVHLLIYVPVAGFIVTTMRRAGDAGFSLPGVRRLSMTVLAPSYLVGIALFYAFLPAGYLVLEPVHRSLIESFDMAPPELMMVSAPGPRVTPGPPLPHPRPIILIIVDAMRPDRMGVYNPQLNNTPFLSGLMRTGALKRVDHAYGSCTFSFCGIMGILASRTWDDFGRAPGTVMHVLAEHRYRNYVIISGDPRKFGNLFNLYSAAATEFSTQKLNSTDPPNNDLDVLQRLQRTSFPDPASSFLYLHLMSVHAGSYLMPQFRRGGPASDYRELQNLYPGANFGVRYDMAVGQADEIIRRAFAILEQKGLLNDAIVLITADHGERLGEDGRYMHGFEADERTLTIPMLIYDRGPTQYPERPIAGHIDIAPTMLRAAGAPIPGEMTGIPLQERTARNALPYGTVEATGAVIRRDDGIYQLNCDRASGRYDVRKLGMPQLDGLRIPENAASQPLFASLKAAFHALRRAGPVNLAPC